MDLNRMTQDNWIEVNDNFCPYTIEDFPYELGVDEVKTYPHCWRCVVVNNCWFKNEISKKPDTFDYSKFKLNELFKIIFGLYHPNCHCSENHIPKPNIYDIKTIIPEGKIWWLFSDKVHWVHDMGYINEDENKIIEVIDYYSKKAYVEGKYKITAFDNRGFRITLFLEIPGKNHRQGETFKIKSGFTIFPNGKIKNNTLLGGKCNAIIRQSKSD